MEYIIKYNYLPQSLLFPIEILNCHYAIAELLPADTGPVVAEPWVEYLEPADHLFPSIEGDTDDSGAPASQSMTALTGSGVAIGIIDSGIDTAHSEFKNPDGTSRILAFWDMTAEGIPPAGFLKGRVFYENEINSDISQNTDSLGHGTAVAGIAAGNHGIAPEASIIAVRLQGAVRTTDILRGVKFVLDEAHRRNIPCVVNLSYGTNNGSHRGQSLFETCLDDMALSWKTVLVCAAGNEGDSGHHYRNSVHTGQQLRVEFTVASLRGQIYLTLWKNFVDTVSYELVLPNGRTTGKFPADSQERRFRLGNVEVLTIPHDPTHYSAAQEIFFQLNALDGTLTGIWTLICYGEQITDGIFDIWLPTIEEVSKDTSFLEPFPDLTITLPATASRTLAVGGYRSDTGTLSTFSGRGELGMYGAALPDLAAPAERILAAKAGGGFDYYSGTSMAAAHLSGTVALLMEWGLVWQNDPFLYGEKLKAYLQKNAVREPFLSYPNPLWGYGKLDFNKTLRYLMQL